MTASPQIDPQLVDAPAHLVEQCRDPTRQRPAVDQPGLATEDPHVAATEGVVALGQTAGGHRVADQRDAARSDGVEHELHGGAVEVHAVGDELDDGLAAGGGTQGCRDGTGGAVVQRRHTVEEVGDQGETAADAATEDGAQGTGAGGVVGVGVPERTDHAVPGQGRGEAARRIAFGGERHVQEATSGGGHQGVHEVEVDVDEDLRVLGAAAHRRQERALEVHAGEVACIDERCEGGAAGDQHLRRSRDERADDRGGAGTVVVRDRDPGAVGVRTELAARTAVAVHVDQPGQQRHGPREAVGRGEAGPQVRQLVALTGVGDPVTLDDERAVLDDAAGQDEASGQQQSVEGGGLRGHDRMMDRERCRGRSGSTPASRGGPGSTATSPGRRPVVATEPAALDRLLLTGRLVLPSGVVEDGALVVEGDRISYAGGRHQLPCGPASPRRRSRASRGP